MADRRLILIDTCIWVSYFNRHQSPIRRVVDSLIDDNSAAIVGPIVTEVLHGFRRAEHADWVANYLKSLQYLHVTWDEWRYAAALGRNLVSRGHSLPVTDLVIAAVAVRRRAAVYSADPHFKVIDGLLSYVPSDDGA